MISLTSPFLVSAGPHVRLTHVAINVMATLTSRCGNDQSSSHDHYDGLEELHCDEGVKCWAEPMSCWSSGDVASSGELVRMWSVQ
jgi:hypothetical protein